MDRLSRQSTAQRFTGKSQSAPPLLSEYLSIPYKCRNASLLQNVKMFHCVRIATAEGTALAHDLV